MVFEGGLVSIPGESLLISIMGKGLFVLMGGPVGEMLVDEAFFMADTTRRVGWSFGGDYEGGRELYGLICDPCLKGGEAERGGSSFFVGFVFIGFID